MNQVETLVQFIDKLREGVYITTADGRILDANPAFLAMFGVRSLRELRRYTAEELLVDPARRSEELEVLAHDGHVREFELEIRRPDGELRTVLDTAYQMHDPTTGELLYHGILVDITDRKSLERQLRELAIRDPLTGAFNRRRLALLEAETARSHEPCGVIVVDIDHFKAYNDRWGHEIGDRVLVQTCRFLHREVRADDVLVRTGGDEFVLLLRGGSASRTERVAARLRERAPDGAPVPFSLGWSLRTADEPLDETIRRADRQLIQVRVRTRRRYSLRRS